MDNNTTTVNENEINLDAPECDVLNEIYKPFIDLIRFSLPEDAIRSIN